jgi:hypothetical protein
MSVTAALKEWPCVLDKYLYNANPPSNVTPKRYPAAGPAVLSVTMKLKWINDLDTGGQKTTVAAPYLCFVREPTDLQ